MNIHIVTIFPQMFDSYLGESILKRATEDGILSFSFYDPREKTEDAHKQVDDRPYGGGPGMVMKAEPILKTVDEIVGNIDSDNYRIIMFSPSAQQYTNAHAQEYAGESSDLILICGRYEGIDGRVHQALEEEYGDRVTTFSVGPYVLTGGELPAMIVIDSVARHVPGVLGNETSPEEHRTASPETYTRPETFEWKGKSYKVPDVLLSGHHKEIEEWRKKQKEQ